MQNTDQNLDIFAFDSFIDAMNTDSEKNPYDSTLSPDNPFDNVTHPSSKGTSKKRTGKKFGAFLLIVGILGLVFFSPLLQTVPFIASIRGSYVENSFLGQLPSILWIALAVLGCLLCFRPSRKPKASKPAKPSKTSSLLNPGKVENWPAGLSEDLCENAMQTLHSYQDKCFDAFSTPPGIRLLMVVENTNSGLANDQQDKIYHWTWQDDHYVIDIPNIINGTMHFVLQRSGKAFVNLKVNGVPTQISLQTNTPVPVVRKNRAEDTVEKCYITLLGGQ